MSSPMPIVKRIDHIMIQVTAATYDALFSFLTQTLQLPIAWPINTDAPGFKTAGVFAGNISMEIFQSGQQDTLSAPGLSGSLNAMHARLYGIALEPYDLRHDLHEVDRRAIPHSQLSPVPEGIPGAMGSMWTLLFFGDMLGADLAQTQSVMQHATDLSPFFNTLFHNGMVFLCEYTKPRFDTTHNRHLLQMELGNHEGGSLGLLATSEITVGAADFDTAQQQWQRLLDPIQAVASGLWPLGDGPCIRLIPHAQDGLLHLTWQVASLQRAEAFLAHNDIDFTSRNGELTPDPTNFFGINVRLVE